MSPESLLRHAFGVTDHLFGVDAYEEAVIRRLAAEFVGWPTELKHDADRRSAEIARERAAGSARVARRIVLEALANGWLDPLLGEYMHPGQGVEEHRAELADGIVATRITDQDREMQNFDPREVTTMVSHCIARLEQQIVQRLA